ncbi:uncharacterized protein LOC141907982 [Tubulanus polymorphus]|uniref:uncharacterized protein LOC141907982 n=1 Tax=Tubulanus polymorphus TaxID=672921 RepID=UPI003DA2C58E
MATDGGCVDDYSLLRCPVDTSVRSMIDYLECAVTATDEVRGYLARDVNVILECRSCRGLFRSLPNLIAHKRVYCRSNSNNSNHDDNRDRTEPKMAAASSSPTETLILEPTNPDSTESKLRKRVSKNAEIPASIAERVLNGTYNGKSPEYRIFTDAKEKRDRDNRDSAVEIELLPIDGNSNAVFQSVVTDDLDDPAPSESSRSSKRSRRSGGDNTENGNKSRAEKKAMKLSQQADLKELSCRTCGMQFNAKKLLLSHISLLHCGSRTIYPCLYCECKFSALTDVSRHLEQKHNKPATHFDRIRETVRQQSFVVNIDAPPVTDESGAESESDEVTSEKSSNCCKTRKPRASRAKSPKGEKTEAANEAGKSSSDRAKKSSSAKSEEKIEVGKAEKSQVGRAERGEKSDEGKPEKSAVDKPAKKTLLKRNAQRNAEKKTPKDSTKQEQTDSEAVAAETADSLYAKRRRLYSNIECIVVQRGSGKAFKCPICERLYDKRNTLRKHIWRGNCSNFKTSTPTNSTRNAKRDNDTAVVVAGDESAVVAGNEFDRVWIDIYGLTIEQIRKVETIIDRDQNKCVKCQRCFGILSNLRHHAVRHLGIQRYKCNLCDYKAFMQATIRTHLKRTHNKHILDGHPDMHKYIEMLIGEEVTADTNTGNRRISSRLQSAEDRRAAAAAAIAKVTTQLTRPVVAETLEQMDRRPVVAQTEQQKERRPVVAQTDRRSSPIRAGAMVVLQDIVKEYDQITSKINQSCTEERAEIMEEEGEEKSKEGEERVEEKEGMEEGREGGVKERVEKNEEVTSCHSSNDSTANELKQHDDDDIINTSTATPTTATPTTSLLLNNENH